MLLGLTLHRINEIYTIFTMERYKSIVNFEKRKGKIHPNKYGFTQKKVGKAAILVLSDSLIYFLWNSTTKKIKK